MFKKNQVSHFRHRGYSFKPSGLEMGVFGEGPEPTINDGPSGTTEIKKVWDHQVQVNVTVTDTDTGESVDK